MNTLSGVGPSGFNPTDLLQKISQRFEAFDTDKSGSLSKTEMTDVRTAKGLDVSKIDKVFGWLDIDGDGSVSRQEHEDRLLAMAERKAGHSGLGDHSRTREYATIGDHTSERSGGAKEIFGALRSLFESIDSSTANSEQMDQLRELSQKIEVEGFSEENLSALMGFLTSMVPPIDSTV